MWKTLLVIFYVLAVHINLLKAQSQCTVTHYDEFSGMAQWWVTQVVQDKQGMIWISTWNGLNRYDGYQFETFKSRVGDGVDIPSDRIMDMVMDKNGNLLCFIDGRVFLFNVKTCKYSLIDKRLERRMIVCFNKRHNRELADAEKPIIIKDHYGKTWNISNDLEIGKDVKYCVTDREGNVWLRSMFGVYRLSFSQKSYTFFPQKNPGQIRCFYVDKKKRYWVVCRDDKSVRLFNKDNCFLGYLGKDGLLHSSYVPFGSPIYNIMQDSHSTFWFCSKPDGLFRLRENSKGKFTIKNFIHSQDRYSLSNNELYYTKEDRYGRLWIATFGDGVNCILNPQSDKPFFMNRHNGLCYPKNKGQRTRQIHITHDGVMLVATTSGLIVADVTPKDIRRINFKCHVKDVRRASSLSNNATMYVTEDSKHRLYVCTESGGVNRIISKNLLSDKLEFRHYNMTTGLPSDVALSAVAMSDSLLIVSNNQLILLNPDRESSMNNTAFFWKDKLRFSDACPTQLPDGKWIFGLQDGCFTIQADKLQKSYYVPNLVLTGLSVENGNIDHSVCWEDTLVLHPSKRSFTVYFAALNYSGNDNISYAFQMGQEPKEWNLIGKNRSATFLDLRPGEYQLKIRSTNNDGIWVDNIRVVTIIVEPTFWETPIAKFLYFLFLLVVVWCILRARRYVLNLKRHQQELHKAYLALLNRKDMLKEDEHEARYTPSMKPDDEVFMQRAMKFIEEHIGDSDINIGDMAEATFTSRSGLNRKMKSLVGVTPLHFIREARIRKACQMLKGGATVNDVACSCGFSDSKYFGKCFKSEIGMTPLEYKKQAKKVE